MAEYNIKSHLRPRFEAEVLTWIQEGWLKPVEKTDIGLVPLLAVDQESKGKVRPVMDFRELNKYIQSHTGNSDVCSERLRVWRRMGKKMALLDLRKAYLQIQVAPELWQFQTIEHKGRRYQLTRLGFGLSSAPKIMSAILGKVLSLDTRILEATSHYIDDIANFYG